MAVVVPSSDLQGTILQNNVNNIQTLITANPNNTALIGQLLDAQQKLCVYLVANLNIIPSAILANETYVGDMVIR
jgi:hypothetical protein